MNWNEGDRPSYQQQEQTRSDEFMQGLYKTEKEYEKGQKLEWGLQKKYAKEGGYEETQ